MDARLVGCDFRGMLLRVRLCSVCYGADKRLTSVARRPWNGQGVESLTFRPDCGGKFRTRPPVHSLLLFDMAALPHLCASGINFTELPETDIPSDPCITLEIGSCKPILQCDKGKGRSR